MQKPEFYSLSLSLSSLPPSLPPSLASSLPSAHCLCGSVVEPVGFRMLGFVGACGTSFRSETSLSQIRLDLIKLSLLLPCTYLHCFRLASLTSRVLREMASGERELDGGNGGMHCHGQGTGFCTTVRKGGCGNPAVGDAAQLRAR